MWVDTVFQNSHRKHSPNFILTRTVRYRFRVLDCCVICYQLTYIVGGLSMLTLAITGDDTAYVI